MFLRCPAPVSRSRYWFAGDCSATGIKLLFHGLGWAASEGGVDRMARSALVTLALVLVVTSRPVSAQSFYATIRGAVSDAAGVIPGVILTTTDERTGVARTTSTNDVGEYVFA